MKKAAEQTFAVTGRPPEAIRTVAAVMSEELELTALLNLLVKRVVALIDIAEMGALYLWDETTQTLVPQAWHNIGEWIREIRLKPGEGMAGVVAQRRQGLAVDAYKHTPCAFSLFTERLDKRLSSPSRSSMVRVSSASSVFPQRLPGGLSHRETAIS